MKTLTVSTFCLFIIMVAVIIFSPIGQVSCAENPFINEIKTVVLDPGHGGHDHGAKGPAGTLEKNITELQFREVLKALYTFSEMNIILESS